MVFLGFRPSGLFFTFHHLGRETFLAPVTWTDDHWPRVSLNGTVELNVYAESLPMHPWEADPARDDFNSDTLSLCWNFIRNPRSEDWSLTARPGWLRLCGAPLTLSDKGSPAFVGRRQQHFDCQATTLLDFEPRHTGEEAGLTVLTNERHHYEVGVTCLDHQRFVIVRRQIGDLVSIVAQHPIGDGPVKLEIQATAQQYTFAYALGDGPLQPLTTAATQYLSREVAGGFTGVYIGMYATGNGKHSTAPADFDWFHMDRTSKE
jgi:alpha-N-arabinofuranosidase